MENEHCITRFLLKNMVGKLSFKGRKKFVHLHLIV